MGVRAVFFDVGETLLDESREYGAWADWLNIPRHTFSSVFGAVIARGRDYRDVFEHFQPGFDLGRERGLRAEAGRPEQFDEADLYPDARRALAAVQEAGYLVGIAGNQTAEAGALLRDLDLPHDVLTVSAWLGVEKPDPGFFAAIAAEIGLHPSEVLYVGDRIDNDLLPAQEVGMRTAWVMRGPWAYIFAGHPDGQRADIRVRSLDELPARLAEVSPVPAR